MLSTARPIFALFAVLCAALALAGPVRADTVAERSKAFDRAIAAELAAKDPNAAAIFADANAARERGDLRGALAGFERVRQAAPEFSHAARRQCGVELLLHQVEIARRHCREAVVIDASPENLGSLSHALLVPLGPGQMPSDREVAEARSLAERAVRLAPDDFHANFALAQAAMAGRDLAALQRSTRRLSALGPEMIETHVLGAILAANEGRWSDAEAEVARARALGMPAADADGLLSQIHGAQPLYRRVLRGAGLVVGTWLGALVLLAALGWLLSFAAIGAAAKLPKAPTGRVHGWDAVLRRAYRVVLWVACAYYYASIPLVLATVLLLGAGSIFLFFALGQVPIKLVAVILIVVVLTTWGVIKSLFVRVKDEDPGKRVDLDEHPALRAVLDEVAREIGTRPVDNVYLTPGTEVAVTERGSVWRRLRGARVERCLILGAGVLEGMRLVELRSVLAHEYGHFQNEDTAGGGFALAVRRSMLLTAIHLAKGGVAAWYNPAWWFVRGFFNLFLRISQGASRLQEVLADRWATFTYGSDAFERGLRHAIERSVRFEAHTQATLDEVVETKHALANLYTFTPAKPVAAEKVSTAIEEALGAKASPFDSHPAPADRLAMVRALAVPARARAEDDDADAWTIFADREAIELLMTEELRARAAERYGVELPRPTT